MKKIYHFVVIFLLSVFIVFFLSNVLVSRYEKKARRELERNITLIIEAIQNRLQPFLGVENDKDLVYSVLQEVMDENNDLVCIEIRDSLEKTYLRVGEMTSCEKYMRFAKNIENKSKTWMLREKSSDVFMVYNTVLGVFGGEYHVFYVLRTRIFSPLYSLRFYFYLLALIFILMEFFSFILLGRFESKLAKYRETLISFEQASVLDRLAGSLAHEIKNPLFILSGNIELANIKEEDKKLLLSEIQRIRGIIERYGNVFKKDHSKRNCSPYDVLKDIEALFKMQFEKEDLSLSIECRRHISIEIPPDQFKQIAINLVLNALQAKSSICITCSLLKRDVLRIDFCSAGKRISTDIEKRMFEPYFSTKREGTGLGLFVAKTIVEGYGGKFFYEYKNNKNCFVIKVNAYENTDN